MRRKFQGITFAEKLRRKLLIDKDKIEIIIPNILNF